MAIAARHVCTAGVALLGVGAFAFTPVSLPLQALTLRTVAVPAGDLAHMPAWIAAGAGLDDRIGIAGPLPHAGVAAPLPGPSAVLGDSGATVVPYVFTPSTYGSAGTAPDGTATTATIPGSPEADALARVLGDPTVLAAVLETATVDVRMLIHDAVTSVVGAVAGLAGDVLRVPGLVVTNVLPLIAAVINVPVAVADQFMSSAALVVESLATLDPLAVTDAFNQGVADVQQAALDAVGGVVDAWDTMRGDVTTALRPPASSVATSASRGSHSSAPAPIVKPLDPAASEHADAGLAQALADEAPTAANATAANAQARSSATPGVSRKAMKAAEADSGPTAGTRGETREHTDATKPE